MRWRAAWRYGPGTRISPERGSERDGSAKPKTHELSSASGHGGNPRRGEPDVRRSSYIATGRRPYHYARSGPVVISRASCEAAWTASMREPPGIGRGTADGLRCETGPHGARSSPQRGLESAR